jgi:hypothetical protein
MEYSTRKDLTAQKFGQLEVIGFSHVDQHRTTHWLCKCSCGNEKAISGKNLRRNLVGSCGCGQHNGQKGKAAHNRKDLTGLVLNDLTVIRVSHTIGKVVYWLCKCKCGNEKAIRRGNLLNGQKDCGHKKNLQRGEASFNNLLRSYKMSAERRGYEFLLTTEEFRTLTSSNCHYCGDTPREGAIDNKYVNGIYLRNGIDRVDNSIGYILTNCVPCCSIHNDMKGELTYQQFIDECIKVANNKKVLS